MADTGFHVAEADRERLATLYTVGPAGVLERDDAAGGSVLDPTRGQFGGGGLVSTAADYLRFAAMLANCGVLDDARILGPLTVDTMLSNHLPGAADLEKFGRAMRTASPTAGVGQGFGVSVAVDPVASGVPMGWANSVGVGPPAQCSGSIPSWTRLDDRGDHALWRSNRATARQRRCAAIECGVC